MTASRGIRRTPTRERTRLTRTERAWKKWAKRVWNLDVSPRRLQRMVEVAEQEGIEAP